MGRDSVVAALAAEQDELHALLVGMDEGDWQLPADRCPGWTVADVVLHLCQTHELALASLDGTFAEVAGRFGGGRGATTIDDVVDEWVAAQRGQPPAEVERRWDTAAAELVAVLETTDLHRKVPWATGDLTARTLATTRLAETWIHGGDVADAVSVEQRPTDRLWHIARLAWRSLPYAFARAGRSMHGDVALELRAPDGDTWSFAPDRQPAATTITGDAHELCLVAARRLEPQDTTLRAEGADAVAVLDLIRTYA